MESTTTLMELDTRVSGLKTSSTETERKSGPIMLVMKDHTRMERNTDVEPLNGLMGLNTLVISLTTTLTEKVCTPGLMDVSTMVSGKATKCTEKEFSLGLMEECIRVNMSMIRRKVTVFSLGPTTVNTTANGKMESSTVSVPTTHQEEKSRRVSGLTESVPDGWSSN